MLNREKSIKPKVNRQAQHNSFLLLWYLLFFDASLSLSLLSTPHSFNLSFSLSLSPSPSLSLPPSLFLPLSLYFNLSFSSTHTAFNLTNATCETVSSEAMYVALRWWLFKSQCTDLK
jgi:hypothetical protein